MSSQTNKLLKKSSSFLAVFAFLLSTFVSNQSLFALEQDCGAHYIELCSEHNNSHFVKTHVKNSSSDSLTHAESNPANSSHDSSHQIEIDNPYSAIIAKQIVEYNTQLVSAVIINDFVTPSLYQDKHQYYSLDPPRANNPLSYLKTVRLII